MIIMEKYLYSSKNDIYRLFLIVTMLSYFKILNVSKNWYIIVTYVSAIPKFVKRMKIGIYIVINYQFRIYYGVPYKPCQLIILPNYFIHPNASHDFFRTFKKIFQTFLRILILNLKIWNYISQCVSELCKFMK